MASSTSQHAATAAITAPRLDDLRTEVVMAAAERLTRLDDWGDRAFVEGLGIFLEDLRTNAHLSERGIHLQYQEIVRMLSNRLRFERDLERHPEIRDERIVGPIIIIGLTRTGSSHLQRLMSADPNVQRLERWRLENPAPLESPTGKGSDPRIAMSETIEAMTLQLSPELMACHAMEAREPDEELTLLEMTYECVVCSLKTHAPLHRAFVDVVPPERRYRYLHQLLQYLQWQDGGARGRPWIMKCPLHTGVLRTVVETFPDATFVYTHRDLREAIPSMFSTMELIRMFFSDTVDLHEIGDYYTRFYAREVERHFAARRELGDSNIVDVYYEDICRRPESVVAEIYARARREFTPHAKEAIARYCERRPKGHFGKHEYTAERYGQSFATIEAAFADYLDRFPRVRRRR